MSVALDSKIIETLKTAGLYDGLAKLVEKDAPAVADVHVSSAGGSEKPKRKPLTFTEAIQEVDKSSDAIAGDTEADVLKADGPRALRPMSETMSHTPFPHDADGMGKMRGDQVPKFLGAISDPSGLELRDVPVNSLVSLQNRVDHGKVEAMRGKELEPPVVTRFGGRNYIADGHHRAAAQWLDGKNTIPARYANLTPKDEAVKAPEVQDDDLTQEQETERDIAEKNFEFSFRITKGIPDKQQIFGWASVVEKDGKLVIDKQGDMIMPEDLESGVYDYVLYDRDHGEMHDQVGKGRLIESMVFTKEKQKALGIYGALKSADGEIIDSAWWAGWKVDSADLWKRYKSGELKELSIGGSGIRVPV